MVSYDGYIYFSALEKIDRGNYSCSVQSSVGNNGRNGPFFELQVTPKSVARCGQVWPDILHSLSGDAAPQLPAAQVPAELPQGFPGGTHQVSGGVSKW